MTVGWAYHPLFLQHRPERDHPEQPERLEAVVRGLRGAGLLERMRPLEFTPATAADLALAHDPAYVELVRLACAEGFGFIGDRETHLCPASFDVAALASGAVLAACGAALSGDAPRSFCAVRPPGHHAGRDRAMGFCLFNHVAVAAEHLLRRRHLARVAVVDLDAHHGNGTQEIFARRPDVLYVSVHEHPLPGSYPGTGYRSERGAGPGTGFSVNCYVPRGARRDDYLRVLRGEVRPALAAFEPQFLLLSMGFDALRSDPLGHLGLAADDFHALTAELVEAAQRLTGGRLVSVLEGGYDLRHLGACAVAHVRALFAPEGR